MSYNEDELITEAVAYSRVAAGTSWLDLHVPGWWQAGRFSLDRFNLTDGCQCVIGQLYAATGVDPTERGTDSLFDEAIEDRWLDLSFDLAEELGLYAGRPYSNLDSYAVLDREWRRVIEARQSGGAQ